MIRENTIFILGAGASADYNFPIGTYLRDRICDNLSKQNMYTKQLAEALAEWKEDIPEVEKAIVEFSQRLKKSAEPTIDAFMEYNYNGYGKIAKLAIAQVLLHEENEELLHENIRNNWYMNLYQKMKASPPKNFHLNNVTFVTFNYDISLDHFFYITLLNSMEELTIQEVTQSLSSVPIFHLYGKIGDLSWQNSQEGRIYGSKKITTSQLKDIAKGIRTIHDNFDPNNDAMFKEVATRVKQTDNIIFIGFAFDESNLKRLPIQAMKGKKIIATSWGLNNDQIKIATEYFNNSANNKISFLNVNALEFVLGSYIR